MIKKVINNIKILWSRTFCLFYLLLANVTLAYADSGGVIPISDIDQTGDSTSFASTIMDILQQDILPLVEVGSAAVVLFVALNGLWAGYKEYQKDKNMDHLKGAVISSCILIVVGGAVLYLLDRLRTYSF